MSGPRLFLLAGEPSGDALGAALIRALRAETGGGAQVCGVGGPLMAAEGMPSLFPQDDLAIMGLVEVLPRLPVVLRRLREATAACLAAAPDALVSIDSPGFGLRVARRVRRAAPSIRTIHYVAPSVWAWRPGRAKAMAAYVDHVLAVLPFEPPYFTRHGMTCDFVGHPAVSAPRASDAEIAALREALAIPAGAPVLLALPGSRAGELRRHGPLFGAILRRLTAPGLQVVLPTVPGVADMAQAAARDWPAPAHVLDPRAMSGPDWATRKRAAFGLADAALAASGTVTLELAVAGAPMVSVYRTSAVTAAIVRRLVSVDTANLINLVAGRRVVPEFLQEYAEPGVVADALAPLLADSPARRSQIAAFDGVADALGRKGPSPATLAARSVLRALGPRTA